MPLPFTASSFSRDPFLVGLGVIVMVDSNVRKCLPRLNFFFDLAPSWFWRGVMIEEIKVGVC